jgi:hypothetical protein
MRLLTILSFLLFCASLSAQKNVELVKKDTVKTIIDTSTAPILAFENTVVSYGSVAQGSNPYRTVKFTNKGKTPLIITHCESPCSCLIASASTEPVPPGGSGEIQLKYNTALVGTFNKTVTVHSNAKKNVVLSVKGIVRAVAAPKKTTKK